MMVTMLSALASVALAAPPPGLRLALEISPTDWEVVQPPPKLTVVLTNATGSPVNVLLGYAGARLGFFDLFENWESAGKTQRGSLSNTTYPRFIISDDMPAPSFRTLQPGEVFRGELASSLVGSLAPGRHRLQAVYIVEPVEAPSGEGIYAGAIREQHAFVGELRSNEVVVTVKQKPDVYEIDGAPVTKEAFAAFEKSLKDRKSGLMCGETPGGGITSYFATDPKGVRYEVREQSEYGQQIKRATRSSLEGR
jgi:hypothetical protein